MILKTLGILDLISAIIIWVSFFFKIMPETFVLTIAIYLIIKGGFFLILRDPLSALDVVIGILAITSLYIAVFPYFIIVSTLYLIAKGSFSLFA